MGFNNNTIEENVKENLKKLLDCKGLTQKDLAEKLDIQESTLSNYKNGSTMITTNALIKLHEEYDIDINEFLFNRIYFNDNNDSKSSFIEGKYYLYYFNTDGFTSVATDKKPLFYGIINVGDEISGTTKRVNAILNLESSDEMSGFENSTLNDFEDDEQYGSNYYWGTVENDSDFYIFILKNKNGKRFVFIVHNPKSQEYIGGSGTLNSICGGRVDSTAISLIGISREKLNYSDEEIIAALSMESTSVNISEQVDEIYDVCSNLFTEDNLIESQVKIILSSAINGTFYDFIQKKLLHYTKDTEIDDDRFYHLIKENTRIKDKEEEVYF